ncbi:MAG: helix-turn-helix transcriptional regulator, partial [Enterobacteriaceae bacterium]
TYDTLEQKLSALADLRQKDGYMAELLTTDEGQWMLVENHCPINAAAHTCNTLCHSELKLFYRLFGSRYHIERSEHIIAGARRCAYIVTPLES